MLKSKTQSWSTPLDLYQKLDNEFHFDDFDPCPLNDDPSVDGLQLNWADCTFVNPPYNRLKSTKKNGIGWVEKAHIEAQKGKKIVMLIPARTDTTWFHDIIVKNNYKTRFIKGRLKFGGSKTSAPFPSMIVIFQTKTEVSRDRRVKKMLEKWCVYHQIKQQKKKMSHSSCPANPTCCLCGKQCENLWGNNAGPIKAGICCDQCNSEKVIPARIASWST